MNLDWKSIEETLYELAVADIRDFAKQHGSEVFCDFFLDCNADYGDVLLCLNTPQTLNESAEDIRSKYPCFYLTFGAALLEMRSSPGDFKYQGFNSDRWEKSWPPFQESIVDAIDAESDEVQEGEEDEPTPSQRGLMETACRVAIRLYRDNVFSCLKTTPDFNVSCANHDETKFESRQRFRSVLHSMTPD